MNYYMEVERSNLRPGFMKIKTAGLGGLKTLEIHSCIYPRIDVETSRTKKNKNQARASS